jgi:hypothetical protein
VNAFMIASLLSHALSSERAGSSSPTLTTYFRAAVLPDSPDASDLHRREDGEEDSMPGRVRSRKLTGAVLAAVLAFLVAVAAVGSDVASTGARAFARAESLRAGPPARQALRSETTTGWHGGVVTAATGEAVTIFVSDSYTPEQVSPQAWADFFARLVHGPELALVAVYIATPAETRELCGDALAAGCYRPQQMVMIGDAGDGGLSPAEVATHEYAHHIATNRVNPPWVAAAYGTKRWASYANVCARAEDGTVFPGDEGAHYRLNPGEGFAEVYRALNESKAGATGFSWLVVDSSFYPDPGALEAVGLDVAQPWRGPASRTLSGRFTGKGSRIWTSRVATRLDGDLTVTLTVAGGRVFDLSLRASNGAVLAGAQWSGPRTQVVRYTVCGQRSVLIRVARRFGIGRFTVRVATP